MKAFDLAELRQQVAELEHPGLAKPKSPSLRELCDERAKVLFKVAFDASGLSQRQAALRLGVCERMVRDWLSGARVVPIWACLALPRDAHIALIRALLESLPEAANDEGVSKLTGS